MATAVRISEELVDEAKKFSRVQHRSLPARLNIGLVWANEPGPHLLTHQGNSDRTGGIGAGRKNGIQIWIESGLVPVACRHHLQTQSWT